MNIFWFVVFWASIFLTVYTYALYPIFLILLKKCKQIKLEAREDFIPTVSVIIAAYNEEKVIAEKVKNLLALNYSAEKIEFLFGSDGSTDQTVAILNEFTGHQSVKVFSFGRSGKVGVLNQLIKKASGDILVFTDANTMFHPDAVKNAVRYFSDEIGCISGQLRLKPTGEKGSGEQGESSYWKYENILKNLESKIGKLSGANGALYAVKRELCDEVPPKVVNDDFYISTRVAAKGYDVIMTEDAIAYEEPNGSLESQFKRHIRDGAGHYQIISMFLNMLSPTKGLAGFTYVSHRFIRWLVPFFIVFAFLSNLALAFTSPVMMVLFWLQVCGYAAMVLYYFLQRKGIKLPIINMVFYFLCVNLSLFIGFFKFIFKLQKQTWETQR